MVLSWQGLFDDMYDAGYSPTGANPLSCRKCMIRYIVSRQFGPKVGLAPMICPMQILVLAFFLETLPNKR